MLPQNARIMLAPDVTFQSLGPGQKTLGDVVDLIARECDVPRDVLLRDMDARAEKLAAEKLLTISAEA